MTYPVTATPRGLTAEELQQVTDTTVTTLRHLVDRLTHDQWVTGLNWYFEVHVTARHLARTWYRTIDQVAGVIAALSPRCRWEDNLWDTESVLNDGEDASVTAYGTNVVKALWILDGSNPEDILGGRKVRSFYRNIAHPSTSLDVTIDAWIIRILNLPYEKYLQRAGVYDAIADAFRTVAEEHGVLPHQLQAAIWTLGRGNHE